MTRHKLFGAGAALITAAHGWADFDCEKAAAFYGKFGLAPSPVDPLLLMILIKDIRSVING